MNGNSNSSLFLVHRRLQVSFATMLLLATVGCSGDTSGPQPVQGKVTFKGSGKPLDRGTVMLESVSDPSVQASGDIQPDGTFELYCTLDKPGTVEGEHRVLIEQPLLETGEKPVVQKKISGF